MPGGCGRGWCTDPWGKDMPCRGLCAGRSAAGWAACIWCRRCWSRWESALPAPFAAWGRCAAAPSGQGTIAARAGIVCCRSSEGQGPGYSEGKGLGIFHFWFAQQSLPFSCRHRWHSVVAGRKISAPQLGHPPRGGSACRSSMPIKGRSRIGFVRRGMKKTSGIFLHTNPPPLRSRYLCRYNNSYKST